MAYTSLLGQSSAHRELLERLTKVASTNVEVLISGPTGVGKELYAKFVHRNSARADAPFVAVNCGALPNDLFENELFGHASGAFTGARLQSDGLVIEAEYGTLFLDEVDSLPLPSQVKILRFIQEKEYRRLGDTRLRRANVRVIAATNIDLYSAAQRGAFREDLFFRLHVFPIEVPPLCKRPEDIPLLLSEYSARFAEEYNLPSVTFEDSTLRWLEVYSWPGNVRELVNCIQYLTCLQLGRPAELSDLPLLNFEVETEEEPEQPEQAAPGDRLVRNSFRNAKNEFVRQFEREYLMAALRCSGGNIAEAARVSGKARRAFFELMRKHQLNASDFAGKSTAAADADD